MQVEVLKAQHNVTHDLMLACKHIFLQQPSAGLPHVRGRTLTCIVKKLHVQKRDCWPLPALTNLCVGVGCCKHWQFFVPDVHQQVCQRSNAGVTPVARRAMCTELKGVHMDIPALKLR